MLPVTTPIATEQLIKLVNQMPAVMWSTDTALLLTSRCGGVVAMFDHQPGAVDGTAVGTFVDPSDRETFLGAHRGGARSRYRGDYCTRAPRRLHRIAPSRLCRRIGDARIRDHRVERQTQLAGDPRRTTA